MPSSIALFPISAFDAYYDNIIRFSYNGNQAIKNRLTIYNSKTNDIVYNKEIQNMKLSHNLVGGSLENGNSYNCEITVYDIENNSITSGKVSFICIQTPVFKFSNLVKNQIIRNASYVFTLSYQQIQNELINEYKITVFTASMSVFWDSGIIYDESLSINITGFADNTLYYIKATGKTVNGFPLNTDLIPFSIEYIPSMKYSIIDLENKEDEGCVKISSNIVSITGISSSDDLEYIDNEMIDLRPDDYNVTFNVDLNGDFLLKCRGYGFKQNTNFISIGNGVKLYWRKGNDIDKHGEIKKHAFVELKSGNYVIFSNRLPYPSVTDMIYFWLRKVSNFYEIKIANLE